MHTTSFTVFSAATVKSVSKPPDWAVLMNSGELFVELEELLLAQAVAAVANASIAAHSEMLVFFIYRKSSLYFPL